MGSDDRLRGPHKEYMTLDPSPKPSGLRITRINPVAASLPGHGLAPERPAGPTRHEVRNLYAVPVLFSATADVPEPLVRVALRGVEEALRAAGTGPQRMLFAGAEAGISADELFEQAVAQRGYRATPFGRQYEIGSLLMAALDQLDHRAPHWPVLLCSQDLYAQRDGWLFGATYSSVPFSVPSVARFMNRRISDEDRELAVARLLRHEVGHMLGLVDRAVDVQELYGLHCTNVCTMRQAVTPLRWIELAREEAEHGVQFCACCQDDLAGYAAQVRPLDELPPEFR